MKKQFMDMKTLEKNFLDLKKIISSVANDQFDEFKIEAIAEEFIDCNIVTSYSDIIDWYNQHAESAKQFGVKKVDLNKCRSWHFGSNEIKHDSGEFFKVEGIRVTSSPTREVGGDGWDQPFLTQVGFDGGILGLIRTRVYGVPLYLVECKFEPGNYRLVQISPTLQATFSNLKRAHNGREPSFFKFFEDYNNNKSNFLRKQWLSEDGGRLFNKRNLGIITEVEFEKIKDYDNNFRLMSLHQLKSMIKNENAIISVHIRSLLSMI